MNVPDQSPTDRSASINSHHRVRTDWIEQATRVLRQQALRADTLTTDDLWPSLPWPGDGRAMGVVIRQAISDGCIEKYKVDGLLQTLDHTDLSPISTSDGIEVRHQGPVVVYRPVRHVPPAPHGAPG